MTNPNLIYLTLMQASDLILSRQISPIDLIQAYLERIQAFKPHINSFITITGELALEQARKIEIDLQKRVSRIIEYYPLLGIPIAFKDLFETKGILTSAGSSFYKHNFPNVDCAVVEKLNQAGGISLGKLNMHEIALGVTNINPHFGPCRNPWSPERISGGSSGGSAAALAAGFCMVSMGTDTGGSIRIPASLCGIVGLKPTRGRVSLRGVIPLSWNLDHAGPMARCVLDTAIVLQAVAGYDPHDPYSPNVPVDDYLSDIGLGVEGWHIAIADDDFFEKTDREIMQAIHQAGIVFENLGAHVEFVPLPGARNAAKFNGLITVSDAAVFHKERIQLNPSAFGDDVLQRLRTGLETTTTEYILARKEQPALRRQYEALFGQYDVLLTPTTPVPAPLIEGSDAVEQARLLTRFTAPFNFTGLPAISLPCGFTSGGLPIGLQIISNTWNEARLLKAAYAFEQATQWHELHPQL